MSILNSIAGVANQSSKKWTVEETVTYFKALCAGKKGQELADIVGRPATGFNHRNKSLEKMFAAAGLDENSSQEDCIAVINGTYDAEQEQAV